MLKISTLLSFILLSGFCFLEMVQADAGGLTVNPDGTVNIGSNLVVNNNATVGGTITATNATITGTLSAAAVQLPPIVKFSGHYTSGVGFGAPGVPIKNSPITIDEDSYGGGETGSNGKIWTVKVVGRYQIAFSFVVGNTDNIANRFTVAIYKNTSIIRAIQANSPAGYSTDHCLQVEVDCVVGDYLTIGFGDPSDLGNMVVGSNKVFNQFQITKIGY